MSNCHKKMTKNKSNIGYLIMLFITIMGVGLLMDIGADTFASYLMDAGFGLFAIIIGWRFYRGAKEGTLKPYPFFYHRHSAESDYGDPSNPAGINNPISPGYWKKNNT